MVYTLFKITERYFALNEIYRYIRVQKMCRQVIQTRSCLYYTLIRQYKGNKIKKKSYVDYFVLFACLLFFYLIFFLFIFFIVYRLALRSLRISDLYNFSFTHPMTIASLQLPESMMEMCSVALTFESVDEFLKCDHSE